MKLPSLAFKTSIASIAAILAPIEAAARFLIGGPKMTNPRLLAIGLILFATRATPAEVSISVRPYSHSHAFYGGGGCIGYEPHLLYGMTPETREMVYGWLFKDLNLDIIRCVLRNGEGAGNDNNDPSVIDWAAFNMPAPYSSDVCKVYRAAMERNPNTKIMAYAGWLPDWIGAIADRDQWADEAAEFLFANLIHLKRDEGISVDYLDVLNEADFGGPGKAGVEERLLKVVPRLLALINGPQNTYGVQAPKICAPSCLNASVATDWIEDWYANNPAVWDRVDVLTTHPYGSGFTNAKWAAMGAIRGGREFIQNEHEFGHGTMVNNGDNPLPVNDVEDELEGALCLSRVFSMAANNGASHYGVFNINSPQGAAKSLVFTPYNGTPVRRKGYWAFKQLTALQPYGSAVTANQVTNGNTGYEVISYNHWGEGLAYVTVVNAQTTSRQASIDLKDHNGAPIQFLRVTDYETSGAKDAEVIADHRYPAGRTSHQAIIAANSVRTFVFYWPQSSSLVSSDDFTNGAYPGWTRSSSGYPLPVIFSWNRNSSFKLIGNDSIAKSLPSPVDKGVIRFKQDVDSLEPGDSVKLEIYDGSWHVAWSADHTANGTDIQGSGADKPDNLQQVEVSLDSYGPVSQVRFAIVANNVWDALFVDDVEVVKFDARTNVAPSAPTNLVAVPSAGAVFLNWDDSGDPDLAGYNVYRSTSLGGPYARIAEKINTRNFVDSGLSGGSTCYYQIKAVDFDGLESNASSSVSVTPFHLAVGPEADTYVRDGGNANDNYGDDSGLVVKTESTGYNRLAFLRFDLSAITTPPTRATLRLHLANGGGSGTNSVRVVSSDAWDESTMTWNTKPAYGTVLNTQPFPAPGSWVEFDVTAQMLAELSGDKKLSLAIQGNSYGVVGTYDSKEADGGPLDADLPTLALTFADSPPPPVQIDAVADTYVRDGSYAGDNYGSETEIAVKNSGSGYNRRAFLRFDLSGIAAPVTSAKLRLKLSSIDGASTAHNVHFVSNDAWDELAMTWSNQPAGGGALVGAAPPGHEGWIEFDVTSQVATERRGDQQVSFLVQETGGAQLYATYCSKDSTNSFDHPRLVVTTAGALPSGWTHGDIGSVGVQGDAGHDGGTFTVIGSGADIWGNADGFHFAYLPFNGDGEIIARVISQENSDPWAKAGVMIRENLNANSKHAMMVVTPQNGVSFQRRTATGGSSSHTAVAGISAPHWVRLVRSGNTFTAYRSATGASWTLVSSQAISSMAANTYAGLVVTSHNNSASCQAVFDNVLVTSGSSPLASYAGFEADHGIAGTGADADTDGDGIANGIEFVIGSDPADATSGSGLLPSATLDNEHLSFTFRRTDASVGYEPHVEYGSDLAGWARAWHGVDGLDIQETNDGFGAGVDKVVVRIPRTLAGSSKLFVRLRAEIP